MTETCTYRDCYTKDMTDLSTHHKLHQHRPLTTLVSRPEAPAAVAA